MPRIFEERDANRQSPSERVHASITQKRTVEFVHQAENPMAALYATVEMEGTAHAVGESHWEPTDTNSLAQAPGRNVSCSFVSSCYVCAQRVGVFTLLLSFSNCAAWRIGSRRPASCPHHAHVGDPPSSHGRWRISSGDAGGDLPPPTAGMFICLRSSALGTA